MTLSTAQLPRSEEYGTRRHCRGCGLPLPFPHGHVVMGTSGPLWTLCASCNDDAPGLPA